ncbi:MAG: ABC transporter permease [Mycobacterium sp.]
MTTDAVPKHTHHASPAHEPPAAVRAAGLVVALSLGLAILFIAFGLPAAKSGPHDVPIGVSGPQAANGQFGGMLEQNAPGAFAVTYYPGEAALRTAIRDRDVYGGIAVTPQGPTLLLASGGSPMVAQLLTQVGSGIAQHTGMPMRTVDLAPLAQDDPRGTGLAASALPLALAGLLPAVILVIVFPSQVWLRFGATVVFAGAAALTIAGVLRYVFGSIETNFWGVTAGLGLGVLATALALLGLGSLFGRVGLAIGAAAVMLLGNPLSGVASAPEMLPNGWGAFGQWLPQGANATLLRSTAFFDGAGATTAIVVLTCWAVAGAVMIVIAAVRNGKASRKVA